MSMFNAEQVEQSRPQFQTIPAGFYRVCVSEIDLKVPKSGNGNFFEFVLTIVQPQELERSKLWLRTTFNSSNSTAVTIGRSQLADFLFTMQVKDFASVDDLKDKIHGKDLIVESIVEVAADGTEYSRIVASFSLGGKHRNPASALKEVKLGATGKPAVKLKPKGGYVSTFDQINDNVPF